MASKSHRRKGRILQTAHSEYGTAVCRENADGTVQWWLGDRALTHKTDPLSYLIGSTEKELTEAFRRVTLPRSSRSLRRKKKA
jgi:hypothetical protein